MARKVPAKKASKTTKKATKATPVKTVSEDKIKKPRGRPKLDTGPKIFSKPDPKQVAMEINMRFGENGPILRAANNAWDASDLRRPCGIPSLDLATGGGLVAGKVHQIDGPESTGKNYLLYRYFGKVQENYGDAACLAMCCFESFVDKHFAQMCGCKIAMSPYDIRVTNTARKAKGQPPLTPEEEREALNCPGVGTFHIFEGPAERVLDGTIAAVKSNIYHLIGIDSWDSMLTAPEEKTELLETPQVASPATLQTRWSKKILDAFNPIYRCPSCGFSPLEKKVTDYKSCNYNYVCPNCKWKGKEPAVEINETTMYCIRQVRAKISMGGKVYGRAYKASGAYALQHLNHIRISLYPGQSLVENKIKIGKEINWEITKAKAGAKEGRTGSYILYLDPLEVDVATDLLNQCVNAEVVQVRAGHFSHEHFQVHGKENAIDLIEGSEELTKQLTRDLYIKSGLARIRFS